MRPPPSWLRLLGAAVVALTSVACVAAGPPLPRELLIDPGPAEASAVVAPRSGPGPGPGEVVPLALGHCGFLSPLDLDGSLWKPIEAADARGGPLDTDDELSELINSTQGSFRILERNLAQFTTPLGSVIRLERRPGAAAYRLCD